MKLTNDTQSLTITEDTVTIRDIGKTYTFQYDDVGVAAAATSRKDYTYLHFYVPGYYEGGEQYFKYLSIGYNEVYNSVVFKAVYSKALKKGNTAIHITGSFTCNVREWLHKLPIQS